MNTVNRDRNTLRRLVESYGKEDVVKYVRHLNEEYYTLPGRPANIDFVLNSIVGFYFSEGGQSLVVDEDEFSGDLIYKAELKNDELVLYVDETEAQIDCVMYPGYDYDEDGNAFDPANDVVIIKFNKTDRETRGKIADVLKNINKISTKLSIDGKSYDCRHRVVGSEAEDIEEWPNTDELLCALAYKK